MLLMDLDRFTHARLTIGKLSTAKWGLLIAVGGDRHVESQEPTTLTPLMAQLAEADEMALSTTESFDQTILKA